MFIGNSAGYGGGAYQGTLNNCELSGNSAAFSGGGVAGATLYSCSITGNRASVGGGASSVAAITGDFIVACKLNNCIVYYNTAAQNPNYDGCTLNYCCTTPLPAIGVGNISADPQLADSSHLSAGSPCRGAGNTNYAIGLDIDGEAWANPLSIGCDEYYAGAATGPLTVGIGGAFPYVAAGHAVSLTALVEGRATASGWDFGDGTTATNQPEVCHTWTVPRDYSLVLRAYNESQPVGISATVTVHVVVQPIHYIASDSPSPSYPYLSWATAATTIQQALDAAAPGALVLVTNGIYATGGRLAYGRLASRAVVDKPLTLWSVNGPRFTVIQGYRGPGHQ